MSDDIRKQLMFEANRKSAGVAYLLWFFVGSFGGHRFYLGRAGTAVFQLCLLFFGWLPLFVGWGLLGIWLFVDLFLIPGMTADRNMQLVHRIAG